MSSWQAKNWDPAVGSTKFDEFCEALDKRVLPRVEELDLTSNETMFYSAESNMVTLPGGLELDLSVLNYAKYIKRVRIGGPTFDHAIEFGPTELRFHVSGGCRCYHRAGEFSRH